MSSSKSNQASTTTNITETITPTLASTTGANTSIISENFQGDIGLTGFDAVQALSDFQDLQRDTALLNSQVTTNALIAASKGVGSAGSIGLISPSVGSSGGGGGNAEPAENLPGGSRLNTAVLLLGGAAAVATVFALRK